MKNLLIIVIIVSGSFAIVSALSPHPKADIKTTPVVSEPEETPAVALPATPPTPEELYPLPTDPPRPAAGRWVIVRRPMYGGPFGRRFVGYQNVWQWQGTQLNSPGVCTSCGS